MDDSRGQIILVAALAIAVTFVALALVVNAVIFTENLATRETVQGGEAVRFQQSVAESGGALMWRANQYNNTSDYDVLTAAFERDVDRLAEGENLHAVSQGSLRDVRIVSIHNGTMIQQTDKRHVNDTQDNSSWQAAVGVSDTRRFVMDISEIHDDEFRVNVTDGTARWVMEVHQSGEIEVFHDGTSVGTCGLSTDERIGITNGSVNGTECEELQFAEGVGTPYDISFENGDAVNASYHLIVDKPETELRSDTPDSYDFSPPPDLHPAIYNSTVWIEVERSDLDYSSNVTIAPEGDKPG